MLSRVSCAADAVCLLRRLGRCPAALNPLCGRSGLHSQIPLTAGVVQCTLAASSDCKPGLHTVTIAACSVKETAALISYFALTAMAKLSQAFEAHSDAAAAAATTDAAVAREAREAALFALQVGTSCDTGAQRLSHSQQSLKSSKPAHAMLLSACKQTCAHGQLQKPCHTIGVHVCGRYTVSTPLAPAEVCKSVVHHTS